VAWGRGELLLQPLLSASIASLLLLVLSLLLMLLLLVLLLGLCATAAVLTRKRPLE
jgi:hypothetical protein